MKKNSRARRYSSGGLKSTRASFVGETGFSQTLPMIFFRFEVIISLFAVEHVPSVVRLVTKAALLGFHLAKVQCVNVSLGGAGGLL